MYDKTFSHIIDRREMLRVKIKNFAQEAALIRREENKILHVKGAGKALWAAIQAMETDPKVLRGLRRAMTRKVGDYGLYLDLHNHRVKHVRVHARRAHLAYGAIRGRTLEQMEPGGKSLLLDHDKLEIQRLFKKYGANGAPIPEWMHVAAPQFVATLPRVSVGVPAH